MIFQSSLYVYQRVIVVMYKPFPNSLRFAPVSYFTIWLFNIAMENGPFIDGLPGFTY